MNEVSIGTRVIAAGATRDGKLRLTISIMPGAAPGGTKIDVQKWPEAIRKFLMRTGDSSGLALVAKPLAATTDVVAPNGKQPAIALAHSFSDEARNGVQKLWNEVAQAALDGSSEQQPEIARFWQAVAEVFGDVPGQTYVEPVAGIAKPVPIVLATGRGDAAVLHLLGQVKRLTERVSGSSAGSQISASTPAGQVTDSWAKLAETHPDQDPYDKANAAKLQELLETAVKEENDIVERQAEAYYQLNKQFFLGSTGQTAPPTLTSAPIASLFNDNGSALEQTQMLHLAALLPDKQGVQRPRGVLSKSSKAGDLEGRPAEKVNEPVAYVARNFVAAIRSSPMLARLFGFVVDFEIEQSGLNLSFVGDDAFVLLGAGEPGEDRRVDADKVSFFSTAKVTRQQGVTDGFWPVTREEVDLRLSDRNRPMSAIRATGKVSQVNGVVDLGQTIVAPSHNPRFDIISIDPVFAMEASVRNANKSGAGKDSLARLGLDEAVQQGPFHNEPERGVISRGLAIVDRWRALSVSEEIMMAAEKSAKPNDIRIIDGDDLTMGYRVDVRARTDDDATPEWRSLMEREIDYRRLKQQGKKDDFIDWFKALSLDRPVKRKQAAELEYEADRRRDYDAGVSVPSSRRRLRANSEMIHAEEMIAAWEGDPLGLNCGQEEVIVRPGSDVAINRTYRLPNEDDEGEHKAWPLRYGWAYRFGIRPVWLGGVSLPLREAVRRYEDKREGYRDLALPGAPAKPIEVAGWRRFLRYEPILAPVALLPAAVALNEREPNFLPQSGILAILRTLFIEDEGWSSDEKLRVSKGFSGYAGRETDDTWRVILPPRVSLDEAVRHGVFDGRNDVGETAPGDLLQIDYDTATERRAKGIYNSKDATGQKKGFPYVARTTRRPPEADGKQKEEAPQPSYEDIFQVHSQPKTVKQRGEAPEQYYADPMADRLVVALRPNNRQVGQQYFAGTPRVFDIRDKNGNVLPVALKIKRDKRKPRQAAPSQEDFWEGEARIAKINGNAMEGAVAGGSVSAQVATLQLRAGESVEIDCWFIPAREKLWAYFGWPEALAVKIVADVGPPTDDNRTAYRTALVKKLKEVLKSNLGASEIGKLLNDYQNEVAWVGLAGKMADPAAIAVAARMLYQHLLMKPVAEISAVRTIDVVHAAAMPPTKPKFSGDFAVLRSPRSDEGRKKVLDDFRDLATAKPFGVRGDDGIVFVGEVMMDRDTCRQLEVVAHCISPARSVLDDIRLGRTELQRLLGEWPKRVVPLEGDAGADGAGQQLTRFELTRSAQHLFGFDVDEEGNAYFPKQAVTLLQLENLAEQVAESDFAKREVIKLVDEQKATLARRLANNSKDSLAKGAIRAAPLDQYSDRSARKIVVTLRATSRFDPYFVRLTAEPPRAPLPETIFPPKPEDADLITRRSYEEQFSRFDDAESYAQERTLAPETVRVMWIPATIAPAKPQVHAVLPSYAIDRPDSTLGKPASERHNTMYWRFRRRPRLRILLDRPWFSSGEGERLGVVLWPPRLREIGTSKNDANRLESGKVPRSVLHSYDKDNALLMELNDFQDEDLGAGGKFTTRWGADPIREASGPRGPFLPRRAILNLPSEVQSAQAREARGQLENEAADYVPSIEIPLRDLWEEQQKQDKERQEGKEVKEDSTAYETLSAALATYLPRFDVETEKWFVDLPLNPDLIVEPFIRLGLVRYQPNAGEGLRASAPVAVWAQIPPQREVEVWTCSNAAGDTVIEVQVSGKVAGRAGTDKGKDRKEDTEDLAYPRMRVGIIEVVKTITGKPIEKIATARKIELRKYPPMTVKEAPTNIPASTWADWAQPDPNGSLDSHTPWYAAFTLPVNRDESNKVKARTFAVVVEEIEEFLSTENDPSILKASETIPPTAAAPSAQAATDAVATRPAPENPTRDPHDEGEPDPAKIRSGPRFLARIDVEYNEAKNQPKKPVIEQKEILTPAQAAPAPGMNASTARPNTKRSARSRKRPANAARVIRPAE